MARVAYAAVALFCFLSGVKGAAQSFGADDLDKFSEGKWFVKFYAPWCGHCQAMAGAYDELADSASGLGVAKIDLTQHESVSTMYGIEGFPTLMLVNEGRVFEYEGERTAEEMKAFAESGWVDSAQSSAIPTASSPLKWEQATSEQKAAWAAAKAGGGSEAPASEEEGDVVTVDGEDKVDVEPIKAANDEVEYDPDFPPLDADGVEIPRDHEQQHSEDADAADASEAQQAADDAEADMKTMQEEFSDPLAFSQESPPVEEDEAGIAEAVVSYTEENAIKINTLSGETPPVMSYVTGPVLRIVFFVPRHCALTLSREGGTYTLSINPEASVRRAFRADGSAVEDSQVSFELPVAPFKFASSEDVFASSRRTANTIAFEFVSGDDASNEDLVAQASDVAHYNGEMPGDGDFESEGEEADPLADESEPQGEEEVAEQGYEEAAEAPVEEEEANAEAGAEEAQEELGDDNSEAYGEMNEADAQDFPEEEPQEDEGEGEIEGSENEMVADTNEEDYTEGEALLDGEAGEGDEQEAVEGGDQPEVEDPDEDELFNGDTDGEGPGEPIDDNLEEIPDDGEEDVEE